MKANVMDSRTGEPLAVGDVVYSLERGDSLRIEAVEVEDGALGERVRVRLLPFGSAFTAGYRTKSVSNSGSSTQVGGPFS